ncbi:hypothetical protein [Burkholderia cepacia]|uniref:hypothetical protein n=1 Tax=Burkholderia cepacia TaxID=292 RepID=UPI002AB771F9|nr:hypothetical protein [Burkholderia cepacia]
MHEENQDHGAYEWTSKDASIADAQGWGLFDSYGHGELQLQRCDEASVFEDDTAAAKHVQSLADRGDNLAIRAIRALIATDSSDVLRFDLRVPGDALPCLALAELYRLWDDLSDVSVDDRGVMQAGYRHFPAGILRDEIWHWFESQHPRFVVGDVMNGVRYLDPQLASDNPGTTAMDKAMARLEGAFGHEHPEFNRGEHEREVNCGDTRLWSYWMWVVHQIEATGSTVDLAIEDRQAKARGWRLRQSASFTSTASGGRCNVQVTIVRPLTEKEVDLAEVGPMYKIRFDDGHIEDAFADELSERGVSEVTDRPSTTWVVSLPVSASSAVVPDDIANAIRRLLAIGLDDASDTLKVGSTDGGDFDAARFVVGLEIGEPSIMVHSRKESREPEEVTNRNTSNATDANIRHIPVEALLEELARRNALAQVHGAIEALHDQLSNTGALDGESRLTSYLMYRLRREAAKTSGTPNATANAQYWQIRIDALGG